MACELDGGRRCQQGACATRCAYADDGDAYEHDAATESERVDRASNDFWWQQLRTPEEQ